MANSIILIGDVVSSRSFTDSKGIERSINTINGEITFDILSDKPLSEQRTYVIEIRNGSKGFYSSILKEI